MAGIYRPRHPERTVLYRVLFHHFDRFLAEYESRFEKEYGFFRLHPHLHFLATEGGESFEGKFHHLAYFQDSLLAEFFKREVFALLLGEELISEDLVEKIAGWRHSGFSVHSKVRAQSRKEAERVGKYMIRPLLSLERLSFDEKEGQVCYRYGEGAEEVERMDYLEFIARVSAHIPDKGQVMKKRLPLFLIMSSWVVFYRGKRFQIIHK